MKQTAIAIVCILAATIMSAQRTTRPGLKLAEVPAIEELESIAALTDTIIAPPTALVEINGYDKPLRSRRETFFVTNGGKKSIAEMAFTITYYDTSRRMLHKASHTVELDVPPTQTRQVSLRSWDPQFAFYYIRSAVPERAQKATPYEVSISVDTIFVR